jgi:hypothetical protein
LNNVQVFNEERDIFFLLRVGTANIKLPNPSDVYDGPNGILVDNY